MNTPDDLGFGYFLEVDLSYLFNIEQKTKHIPIAPENKNVFKKLFNKLMKKIKPKKYIPHKKSICEWTD